MSLARQGFLSNELDEVRGRLRHKNAEPVALLDSISELGQKIVPRITTLSPTRQNLMAGAFFLRGIQSMQGAILMAERGMDLEARTLARSALETLFYLGAAVKEEDFAEDFMRDHVSRLDKLAKAHKELAISDDEDHETLRTAIDGARDIAGEGRPLAIRATAIRAGMDVSYQGFYRGLSTDSAHPTVMSISSHFSREPSGRPTGLLWGPEIQDNDRVQDTMYIIALVGIQLIDTINTLIGDSDVNRESHRLSRMYLKLKGHAPAEDLSNSEVSQDNGT